MAGYQADLVAIGHAAGVLRDTHDTMSAARDQLDAGSCANLGPGRLGSVAAGVLGDARRDLDRVLGSVAEDAELLTVAARGYAEQDQDAADLLRRRAGD